MAGLIVGIAAAAVALTPTAVMSRASPHVTRVAGAPQMLSSPFFSFIGRRRARNNARRQAGEADGACCVPFGDEDFSVWPPKQWWLCTEKPDTSEADPDPNKKGK